ARAAAEAEVAKLRQQADEAAAAAKAAEERLAAQSRQGEAARQQLATFLDAVGQRLAAARLVAANARADELLAGLDQALRRRPEGAPGAGGAATGAGGRGGRGCRPEWGGRPAV